MYVMKSVGSHSACLSICRSSGNVLAHYHCTDNQEACTSDEPIPPTAIACFKVSTDSSSTESHAVEILTFSDGAERNDNECIERKSH